MAQGRQVFWVSVSLESFESSESYYCLESFDSSESFDYFESFESFEYFDYLEASNPPNASIA